MLRKKYKGIVLAGGVGSRLYPNTAAISKQLLPVFSKPTIYYPLSTLLLAGITEIAIISFPEVLPLYQKLFGNGEQMGITISYLVQEEARGIAEALIISKEFIGDDCAALVLGDNMLIGAGLAEMLGTALDNNAGATVFLSAVSNPSEYGIATLNAAGAITEVTEKPTHPKSNKAIIGLYLYNNDVIEIVSSLEPSNRGELEITDVNRFYLEEGSLKSVIVPRGIAWFDTGSPASQLEAANYVRSIEHRENLLVCSPEEIAWRNGMINFEQFKYLVSKMPACYYKGVLTDIIDRQ